MGQENVRNKLLYRSDVLNKLWMGRWSQAGAASSYFASDCEF